MDTPLKIACQSGTSCCGGSCASKTCVLSYLAVPFRFALGGLFLLAAFNKLFVERGPQHFAASVKAFKAIDPDQAPMLFQLAVFGTPWVEIFAGVALILGLWTRAAAGVIAGLLVVFIALIVSVILRDLNTECGCFGKLSPFCGDKVGVCNIVQNIVLLAMALAIANARTQFFALDSILAPIKNHRPAVRG